MSGVGESVSVRDISELKAMLEQEKSRFLLEKSELQSARVEVIKSFNIDTLKARYLGKASLIQESLKSLKNLPGEQRKAAGQVINEYKGFFEGAVQDLVQQLEARVEAVQMEGEVVDLTLPCQPVSVGLRHPIDRVTESLLGVFRRLGFAVVDGPELDTEFYNFDALNMPADHSARDMQDTFFFAPGWLLRTQTSNVQAHALIERGPPLRIVCPGYVYRNESDLTHVPCFRQLECLVVDKGVNMGHLRHTLDLLFAEVFGRPVKTRLRASYFPFTEPSAEVDVECPQCQGSGCRSCTHTGWLEMGGCGIVNKAVLARCGLDTTVWSGFAFGFGLDRLTMIKHKISDLRALFEGDLRFLHQLY